MTTLRRPRIVRRRISPLAALHELGLDVEDVALMKADLRAALARSNNDLIHSFTTKPAAPPVSQGDVA